MNWTKAQQQAIKATGRDVLVTASAGTGKTAVLSHRAVERICDSGDPAQADSLLVLTFTDAAAEEMRSRIAENLRARYAAEHKPYLRQQLLLLDRAYISTIHAFCKRILTEFFYLIDLDPTFGILDTDEQRLLKADILEKTLEEAWADSSLAQGLEILFEGRSIQPGVKGSFVDRIIPLSEFLDSVVSRGTFYERAAALNNMQDKAYSQLLNAQKDLLLEKLARCRSRLEFALTLDIQFCGGQYATEHINNEILPVIVSCTEFLKKDRISDCAMLLDELEFGQLRKKKSVELSPEEQTLIKVPVDKVKKELKTLHNFALLSSDYETLIGTQAGLQTQVLMELVRRFDEHYSLAKQSRNVLDFADLEHTMLKLLDEHSVVASKLSERFEYIFVDEYQDINAVQQRIIESLSRDDNVFVVGDIKQSIYGFRQSKPEIFLRSLLNADDITKTSARPGRVDLQDNFRCRDEIIDFVNVLFGRVMTQAVADMDYDETAQLVRGFDYPPFKAAGAIHTPVELHLLDEDSDDQQQDDNLPEEIGPTQSISNTQRQAAFIARRIQSIVGAETGKPEFEVYDKHSGSFRSVQYRDIVILMRSLSHKAQDYVEMLRLAGVPVSSQSACGYFEATEIKDCLCLLKVLDNADRDIELAALLRGPIFKVTDSQLAAIRLAADRGSSFYQAVLAYVEDGENKTLKEKLDNILVELNQWRRDVHQDSLANMLDRIFRQKQLLAFYSALPNGAQRRANLLKLHDHAIQFEHFRTTEPGAALTRFVEFLEKLAEAEQDWAPAEPDSSSENAVRIMSVHKSKGLEFPVVFVAELNTSFNMRSSSGQCLINEETVGLQIIDREAAGRFATLAHQVIAEKQKKADLAEEMRILYVALTRPREKLILTGGKKETACVKLLTECAAFDNHIADWRIGDVRCHLDWVLMGMADSSDLCRLFGLDGSESNRLFHAGRIGRNELDDMTDAIQAAKRSLKSHTTLPKAGSKADRKSQAAFKEIEQNLLWRYPFEDVTQLAAKLSVSEFTHRDDEFSTIDMARAFAKKPAALYESEKKSSGADALSLGSAVHLTLEHVDLSGLADKKALQDTVAALVKDGSLDQSLARQVNLTAIQAFFESELGQLAQQAGKNVLREWPFTYALDAALIKRGQEPFNSQEIIVLQGIVDMIIPTEDGLVIVDFKTDRVSEDTINERAEQYTEQLRSYGRAASEILKQPVAGAWLYFLTPQMAVEVNC